MDWKAKVRFGHTGNKGVVFYVVCLAVVKEHVGLIEECDGFPLGGEPEDGRERLLDGVCTGPQARSVQSKQRSATVVGQTLGGQRLAHARFSVQKNNHAFPLSLNEVIKADLVLVRCNKGKHLLLVTLIHDERIKGRLVEFDL